MLAPGFVISFDHPEDTSSTHWQSRLLCRPIHLYCENLVSCVTLPKKSRVVSNGSRPLNKSFKFLRLKFDTWPCAPCHHGMMFPRVQEELFIKWMITPCGFCLRSTTIVITVLRAQQGRRFIFPHGCRNSFLQSLWRIPRRTSEFMRRIRGRRER